MWVSQPQSFWRIISGALRCWSQLRLKICGLFVGWGPRLRREYGGISRMMGTGSFLPSCGRLEWFDGGTLLHDRYIQDRNFGCRVSTDFVFRGWRLLVMENELVRVSIILDKGSDIWE